MVDDLPGDPAQQPPTCRSWEKGQSAPANGAPTLNTRRPALLCAVFCALFAFLVVSSAGAQLPPHKFYGNDATLGGQPAPDGATVRAINQNGDIVATGTISGGAWYLDVDPGQARFVRFAIGASSRTDAYPVTSGALTAVALSLSAGTPVRQPLEPPRVPGWELYTLQSGDTLLELSQLYAIPFDDLLAINPQITDPTALRAGDVVRLRRLHELVLPTPAPAEPTPLELRLPPDPSGASPLDPAALLATAAVSLGAPPNAIAPTGDATPPAGAGAADEAAPTTPATGAATGAASDRSSGLITWQRLVLSVIAVVLLGLAAVVSHRAWDRVGAPWTRPPTTPRRRASRFQRRGVIRSAPIDLFGAPGPPIAPATPTGVAVARPSRATAVPAYGHARPAPARVPAATGASTALAIAEVEDPATRLDALRALLDSVRTELHALREDVTGYRARAATPPPQPEPADRRYFRTTPGATGASHGRGFAIGGDAPQTPPQRSDRLRALREAQRTTAQQSGVTGRIAALTDRASSAWLRRD